LEIPIFRRVCSVFDEHAQEVLAVAFLTESLLALEQITQVIAEFFIRLIDLAEKRNGQCFDFLGKECYREEVGKGIIDGVPEGCFMTGPYVLFCFFPFK
jgi:hypothetical protein